ncbi:hypothetical protein SLS59_001857 [Nothophoma quercina]|uniref:Secreted protein n=1 Tax=Nothophoma quercina TaxID=749835 RepID=A0ABR3RXI3_9PLEO
MLPTKIFFTLTMLMAGALALTCVQPNNPTTVDVYDSSVSGTAVSATAIPESDIDEVLHDDEEKEDGDNETISGVVPDTTDEEDVVFEPAWGEASSNDTEVEPENRLARRKAKPCKCAKVS